MVLTAKLRITGLTKKDLVAQLYRLPAILSGRERDRNGIGRLFRAFYTHHLFQQIFESFMEKSVGRADEFGDKWKPLSPRTIAQRPLSRIVKWKLGLSGKRERGLLTPSENRQWKAIFASTLARLLKDAVPIDEAKERAGRTAWAVMKAKGAKTKIAVLGGRHVWIHRVTDRTVDSLSPGTVSEKDYIPFTEDQVYTYRQQEITVGTRVPYAPYIHKMRRLWPSQLKMRRWHIRCLAYARDRMLERVVKDQQIPS